MSTALLTRHRGFERLMAILSAVAVFTSLMVMFAPAALAHHPEISASPTCIDRDARIAYEAVSWKTDGTPGSGHPDIRIEVRVNGAGSWSQVASGAFNAGNNFRFSGSFDAQPYTGQSIEVRARSVGPWDNGNGGGETRTTPPFTVDLDCDEDSTPVDPQVVVSEVCGVADYLVVPSTAGVDYMLDGQVVNGQTIIGPGSGTLVAEARQGYQLTNPDWSFAFDLEEGDPCPGDGTPVDPQVVVSEVCGVADYLVVPSTAGVDYMLDGQVVNGQTIIGPGSGTLVAEAQQGYQLTDPDWSFAFDLAEGDPCPDGVTPVAPVAAQSTTCEVQGTVTFPVTTGIRYMLDGTDVSGQTLAGPISGTALVEVLPGYALAPGAVTEFTFAVAPAEVCDEVLGEEIDPDDDDEPALEELPFTGVETETLFALATVMVGAGWFMVRGFRGREEG